MSHVRRSPSRLVASLLTALVTALLGCTLVGGPLAAPTQAASKAAGTYGSQAFRASNQARADHDRARLGRHACLARYARKQAAAMAEKQQIWHQDLNKVLDACGMN